MIGRQNAREAIALYLESLTARGIPIPGEAVEVIATLDVQLSERVELPA
ncbi:MAG TPA: hypothetical protein VNM91_00365 [Dehalococcoidia bacterium]|nr:hypothetical protein [Dehalococcoidia bacterium]